jgi:TatD DNase family protein
MTASSNPPATESRHHPIAPRFLDSHAHLDGPEFSADREAVMERARAAGVQCLMAIGGGSGPDELAVSVPIAEAHDWIYAAIGIHPHEAAKAEDKHFDLLRGAAGNPKVLAIGEIGLDYHYDHSPRDMQRRVLIRQLEFAREAKLPVVIHCREAWEDLREIIGVHWRASGLGGILHCFTGTAEDARAFLNWGFLISYAGNVSFRNAEALRSTVREVPRDCLLTETDCPFLAPIPHRGKRNEPAFVVEVARQLGSLLNISAEEAGELAVQNFRRFFRLSET